ncbi:ArsR family transcriptional regulator [Gordonia sp. CNJ-863]|uniref:ArsR/SmtB family transcription factor n=1 Tax=Gordonia sp. CNJ-863 TaxID=1904963 RepID=UPI002915D026|nr:helix-turn-helix domain-containing protein [Gordonia sp. CNJ-863]
MPRRLKSGPLDEVFGALANPTRRDILDALLGGEHTAGELAGKFDMARPSVSEHLRACASPDSWRSARKAGTASTASRESRWPS